MNTKRTSASNCAETVPTRYELVRADGVVSPMKFDTAMQAAEAAGYLWPGEEQDEDRTGKGRDVQVEGCG